MEKLVKTHLYGIIWYVSVSVLLHPNHRIQFAIIFNRLRSQFNMIISLCSNGGQSERERAKKCDTDKGNCMANVRAVLPIVDCRFNMYKLPPSLGNRKNEWSTNTYTLTYTYARTSSKSHIFRVSSLNVPSGTLWLLFLVSMLCHTICYTSRSIFILLHVGCLLVSCVFSTLFAVWSSVHVVCRQFAIKREFQTGQQMELMMKKARANKTHTEQQIDRDTTAYPMPFKSALAFQMLW